MGRLRSIRELSEADIAGKRMLVRVDFNVPMEQGEVANDNRIRAALPTISYLLERGARVLLLSHLGRPRQGPEESLRLKPVGQRLQQLLSQPVLVLDDCQGERIRQAIDASDAKVILLENTRFYSAEEANDPSFAKALAQLGDIYVNDAFGAAHRAHASTEGVTHFLPAYAGLLMEKEVRVLGNLLEKPALPFVAIIGGAKVSSKIGILENLLPKVNRLVIGGAMANTFLASQGLPVGNSLIEKEHLPTARQLTEKAGQAGVELLIPVDLVVAESPQAPAPAQIIRVHQADNQEWDGLTAVDIGPASLTAIGTALRDARTILWNGPMGVFENPPFATGTHEVARLVAQQTQAGSTSIVGGGDSVAAVESLGLDSQFSHISTGGGASLEFLEGAELPGIKPLYST